MMFRASGLSSAVVALQSAFQGSKSGTYFRRVAQAKVDAFMLSELFNQIKSAGFNGVWSMSWNKSNFDFAGGGTVEKREYGS